MTNPELKPCWHCGGEEFKLERYGPYFVTCCGCGACGGIRDTLQKAADAWNKRHEEPKRGKHSIGVVEYSEHLNPPPPQQPTLRDEFAMAAPGNDVYISSLNTTKQCVLPSSGAIEAMAAWNYMFADAMLAERAKKGDDTDTPILTEIKLGADEVAEMMDITKAKCAASEWREGEPPKDLKWYWSFHKERPRIKYDTVTWDAIGVNWIDTNGCAVSTPDQHATINPPQAEKESDSS